MKKSKKTNKKRAKGAKKIRKTRRVSYRCVTRGKRKKRAKPKGIITLSKERVAYFLAKLAAI